MQVNGMAGSGKAACSIRPLPSNRLVLGVPGQSLANKNATKAGIAAHTHHANLARLQRIAPHGSWYPRLDVSLPNLGHRLVGLAIRRYLPS